MTKTKEPDEYELRSQEIRQLSGMPVDQLADHFSQAHKDIGEVAPEIAANVTSTAIKAVQFLGSRLPHVGNEIFGDGELKTSKAQKNQWLELYRMVNDPLTILDKIKDKTLTQNHIQAVEAVYPDLGNEMKEKIHIKLGQVQMNKEKLPYSMRLALSKFLGIPLDSTMTQQNRQAIVTSAVQNTSETQAQAGGSKGSKVGTGTQLNQINKVNTIYPTTLQSRQIQKQREK